MFQARQKLAYNKIKGIRAQHKSIPTVNSCLSLRIYIIGLFYGEHVGVEPSLKILK